MLLVVLLASPNISNKLFKFNKEIFEAGRIFRTLPSRTTLPYRVALKIEAIRFPRRTTNMIHPTVFLRVFADVLKGVFFRGS